MFVSFLYLIFYFVFTILAQIVRCHWALAEWRHRKSTCYDYDYVMLAGLCFACNFLFLCRRSFYNGWTDCCADFALTSSIKKLLKKLVNFSQGIHGNQFCGDLLALLPQLFVLAFYNNREIAKPIPVQKNPNEPCTSFKNFMNFSAVNHWDVVSLKGVGGCTHAKIRTFSFFFSPESIDWFLSNIQQMCSDYWAL